MVWVPLVSTTTGIQSRRAGSECDEATRYATHATVAQTKTAADTPHHVRGQVKVPTFFSGCSLIGAMGLSQPVNRDAVRLVSLESVFRAFLFVEKSFELNSQAEAPLPEVFPAC